MTDEDHSLKMMLKCASMLKSLEWTDEELLNLPEKYTKLMIHIALEKADADKDKQTFDAILNYDEAGRKILLNAHMLFTKDVFEWNYYKPVESAGIVADSDSDSD